MLMTAQYRWVGHVTRMDDTRLPKIIFYSELTHVTRSHGGQLKRYKDMLKVNMRICDMQPKELEHITSDRWSWLADSIQGADICLRAPSYTVTSRQGCSTQDWPSTVAGPPLHLRHLQPCLCIKDRPYLPATNSSVLQRSVVSMAQSNNNYKSRIFTARCPQFSEKFRDILILYFSLFHLFVIFCTVRLERFKS